MMFFGALSQKIGFKSQEIIKEDRHICGGSVS